MPVSDVIIFVSPYRTFALGISGRLRSFSSGQLASHTSATTNNAEAKESLRKIQPSLIGRKECFIEQLSLLEL